MSTLRPFDLQVNGCAGVDFNSDELRLEDFEQACAWMREQGCQQFLPTLITASFERLEQRLARLADFLDERPDLREIAPGIHLEGPFLSPEPGYIGAHPADHVIAPSPELADRLLAAARGHLKLLTLAPETDEDLRTVRHLGKRSDLVLSAGHTNATRETLSASIDAGLSLFTHLGNGCPLALPRHDNIIQRALSLTGAGGLHYCFIPDGLHVDFFALGSYLRSAGTGNSLVVSDAISAAGAPPGLHSLGEASVEVGTDGVPRVPGTEMFAGSALGWQQLLSNLRNELHLDEESILELTTSNPENLLEAVL